MKNVNRYIFHELVLATVGIIAVGTVFYHYVEKWNWIDAYYFCVVTLATVGYGDFTPQTQVGRLFTTFYIILGVGILGAFVNALIKRRGDKVRSKESK